MKNRGLLQRFAEELKVAKEVYEEKEVESPSSEFSEPVKDDESKFNSVGKSEDEITSVAKNKRSPSIPYWLSHEERIAYIDGRSPYI